MLCTLVIVVQAVMEWPTYALFPTLDTLYPAEMWYMTSERRDNAPEAWEFECRARWHERAGMPEVVEE